MEKQIATTERELIATQEPSVGGMLQKVIEAGITSENVGTLEKMMDLYERNEKRQAEKEFAAALTALQGETIRVTATKSVDQKPDGSCRYKFAPYEEIMREVQPMLTRNGFSVTFDTETGDNRLTSICTLTHSSGHSRSNKFAVRYGKPPGSSDAQGDMSTKSYAKRGALCDALNISIDHDTDGRDDAKTIGAFVTDKEAAGLRELAESVEADNSKLFRYAGASSFETIPADRYDQVFKMLKKKEESK
jgi:hypothetical protein